LKLQANEASEDMTLLLNRTNFNVNKTIIDEIGEKREMSPVKTVPAEPNNNNPLVSNKPGPCSSMQMNTSDGMVTKGSSDRLIQSISMIKDILLSNMQLREEQFKLAEDHDLTI
jgi:hypothetical protein